MYSSACRVVYSQPCTLQMLEGVHGSGAVRGAWCSDAVTHATAVLAKRALDAALVAGKCSWGSPWRVLPSPGCVWLQGESCMCHADVGCISSCACDVTESKGMWSRSVPWQGDCLPVLGRDCRGQAACSNMLELDAIFISRTSFNLLRRYLSLGRAGCGAGLCACPRSQQLCSQQAVHQAAEVALHSVLSVPTCNC